MKGETSGNRLRVVSAATDCDNDTLLFRVEVEGEAGVPRGHGELLYQADCVRMRGGGRG